MVDENKNDDVSVTSCSVVNTEYKLPTTEVRSAADEFSVLVESFLAFTRALFDEYPTPEDRELTVEFLADRVRSAHERTIIAGRKKNLRRGDTT